MDLFALKNLVKEPTCFKSGNPRCIDLILTNRKRNFQHTTAIETGLSDFHKLIVTVLKLLLTSKGQMLLTIETIKTFEKIFFDLISRQNLLTLMCKA